MTKTVIEKDHPYWTIRQTLESSKKSIASLNFSYYQYTPQSLSDARVEIKVTAENLYNEDYISDLLLGAPESNEVAFHSIIEMTSGEIKHLPMVDMSTQSKAQLKAIDPYLEESLTGEFIWFESGRSYHGYGTRLISTKNWIELMGRFLLANPINAPAKVDPRWIGHRLIAGYSALRWTKNTFNYKKPPKKAQP